MLFLARILSLIRKYTSLSSKCDPADFLWSPCMDPNLISIKKKTNKNKIIEIKPGYSCCLESSRRTWKRFESGVFLSGFKIIQVLSTLRFAPLDQIVMAIKWPLRAVSKWPPNLTFGYSASSGEVITHPILSRTSRVAQKQIPSYFHNSTTLHDENVSF